MSTTRHIPFTLPQAIASPLHGTVGRLEVVVGQSVAAGQVLLHVEAMKMEVPVHAPSAGTVSAWHVADGDLVDEGTPLLTLLPGEGPAAAPPAVPTQGPRADLLALQARAALTDDVTRPQAMAQRHASGLRSARENVADLLDAGSFSEYGAFAVAAQRGRRSLDDLQHHTPADGLITGTGLVGGRPCAVMAYDYTVLAGTQGVWNHAKADRLLELCARQQLPLVGIAAGRCFAGNAALLGCCDLIVAVEGASIGMGGPAMIEGGGLGRVPADAVGPVEVQVANGVVDVRAPDEAAAVQVARRWLALVGQPLLGGVSVAGGDVLSLREAVPRNRHAVYEPRDILRTVADEGSLLELRPSFGAGLVTALARIGGHAVALVASQPRHLGGALDGPACDKLVRFMQLADVHGLPLISFVDTPGFMVGPESEKTGLVRKAGRVFIAAAALRVPVLSVVLRRGYGLGAMALTAGHFHAPVATCAWPSGEFGAMGIEGAVKLGFRKELEAAPDAERSGLFDKLVAQQVERGGALNMASHLEIDEVIDPAHTRDWLLRHLKAMHAAGGGDIVRSAPQRRVIDAG